MTYPLFRLDIDPSDITRFPHQVAHILGLGIGRTGGVLGTSDVAGATWLDADSPEEARSLRTRRDAVLTFRQGFMDDLRQRHQRSFCAVVTSSLIDSEIEVRNISCVLRVSIIHVSTQTAIILKWSSSIFFAIVFNSCFMAGAIAHHQYVCHVV